MKKLLMFFSLCATLFAGETIHPGSKVYVTPTKDDFDRYLMAEIQKQELSIVLVPKREEAEFEITVTSSSNKPAVSQASVFSDIQGSDDETISIINLRTGSVIFSDTVHDRKARRGYKSTAEICARHLRRYIKKR